MSTPTEPGWYWHTTDDGPAMADVWWCGDELWYSVERAYVETGPVKKAGGTWSGRLTPTATPTAILGAVVDFLAGGGGDLEALIGGLDVDAEAVRRAGGAGLARELTRLLDAESALRQLWAAQDVAHRDDMDALWTAARLLLDTP